MNKVSKVYFSLVMSHSQQTNYDNDLVNTVLTELVITENSHYESDDAQLQFLDSEWFDLLADPMQLTTNAEIIDCTVETVMENSNSQLEKSQSGIEKSRTNRKINYNLFKCKFCIVNVILCNVIRF